LKRPGKPGWSAELNLNFTIMKQALIFIAAFFVFALCSCGKKIATLDVELAQDPQGIYVPASVGLDGVTDLSPSSLQLMEIRDDGEMNVPFQVDKQGSVRILHFLVNPEAGSGGKYVYELRKGRPEKMEEVAATDEDGTLTLHFGDQNLLRYYHKTLYPPEGVDTAYKRSGFIHPLWAPGGQVLTRIQPGDHYHHYGIWNPWTHVLFEGDTVDFWNLSSRQGTVRFADFVSVDQGPLYAGFKAHQEHVVFEKDGSEKVALDEVQGVRAFRLQENEDFFITDFDIGYTCATDSPFHILAYRYQGFGWRTTEAWNNQNSEVLTSEGNTRRDADGSKARWCIVQGSIDDNYAGVLMMSYPENYNYPEPLRIWPENQNGRGDMFANFCPAKDRDWLMEPGKKYELRYRLLVYNGKLTADEAEAAWHYFASPPKVTVSLVK
jgi:hypothetical protein